MKKNTFLLLAFSLIIATAHAQTTRYVKPTASGSGDGSSWTNASSDLQLMINASNSGNQVWVASGTYLPQHSPVDGANWADQGRDNAFLLKKDVKVYGGFSGNETILKTRDSTLQTQQTILSGDIGVSNNATDNTYHVVIAAGDVGTAKLNSFIIKNGNANGSGFTTVNAKDFYRPVGGGIYNSESSPILANVSISGNSANSAGGIYNGSSSPILTNVSISGNSATSYGGGIYNDFSFPILTNVSISGNSALYSGGGMSNSASSPILTNVFISENSAANYGGGLYNSYSSSPILTNVTISGNSADYGGGGIYNDESSPILINTLISGNASYNNGGGIYNKESSSPILTNVTISGNKAATAGGGIFNMSSSNPQIRNSIIYGNSTGIANDNSTPIIEYSLVQGLSATTNNNIAGITNPQFVSSVSYNSAPTTTGNYSLSLTSPTIGAGNNTYFNLGQTPGLSAITTDLAGNQRIFGGQIDMGAYEYSQTRYVKTTASGLGDGSSWANASNDLQLMINASTSGDHVWVAAGTYLPQHSPANGANWADQGRDNAFLLKKDVKVYGGFSGNETNLTARDSTLQTQQTILSGDIGTINVATDNSYHVLISAGVVGTAELNSFIIKNGYANGTNAIMVNAKGISQLYGGGIYNSSSSPILSNVSISGNSASTTGGGIFNESSSSPTLTNVTISGNSAVGGGGIFNESSSSPTLTNVTISGNSASNSGGGIYNMESSSPVLSNVSISGNSAGAGAGILNRESSPTLTNVTISGNSATYGGGIYNFNSSNPQIRNSIIYGNSTGIFNSNNSTPIIEYSLVQDLSATTNNNINGSTDPLFVSSVSSASAPITTGDYRVSGTSPTIGAGNNNYFSVGQTPDLHNIAADLDNNQRIFGTQIDMGAYEFGSFPLPITLISFDAIAQGQKAKLIWTTASEHNNKEFILSRSADGKYFKEIGRVAAAQLTKNINDYVYYDEQPLKSRNFYRLQQVDFDGKTTFSGIRTLQFSSDKNEINIFPNPVKNLLEVQFTAGSFQSLELSNITGKIEQVIKVNSQTSKLHLNFKNLPAGVYFLRMTGNESIAVRKIVHE